MSIASILKRRFTRNKDKDHVVEYAEVAAIDWNYTDNNAIRLVFEDNSVIIYDESKERMRVTHIK